MRSIRNKLLIPFILVIIITPMITLVVFNIFVRNYINNGIITQLENTVTTTQVLIKNELSGTLYETDQVKIDQSLANLNEILRTSKIAVNTEMLLYKESGEMIYPITYDKTFINTDLIGAIRSNLAKLNTETAYSVRTGSGERYAVMGYRLTQLPLSNIPTVVFVSSMNTSDPFFKTINLFMVLLMLSGVVIGIFFSVRIAERVSRPVKELCRAAEKIGERKPFSLEHKTGISEIALLSESILTMAKQIEAYDKAQKAFLQNASHELKTPLMSIQGYAEGIEKNIFPDPAYAGNIIKEESKKLDRLLTELLILSRIENRNYDHEFEKTALNEVMKDYIRRMEGIAIRENKVITYLEPKDPVYVRFNESLFTQCLMNLASNAIRYAEKQVTVTLSKTADHARIEIADDGNGFNEKDLPHIYERFYKGEKGQFGLGLAIAKSAIEAMNGTIEACNQEKGAKFTLTVPIWKELV